MPSFQPRMVGTGDKAARCASMTQARNRAALLFSASETLATWFDVFSSTGDKAILGSSSSFSSGEAAHGRCEEGEETEESYAPARRGGSA